MSETLAPVLGEATVQELRDALRGELLQPGDDGTTRRSGSGTAPTTAASRR